MQLQEKLLTGVDVTETLRGVWGDQKFIIAGGAVRDSVLEKPISDIDIYTSLPLYRNKTIVKTLQAIVPTGTKVSRLVKHEYHTWHIVGMVMDDGTEVQLINMPGTEVIDVINSFDIGLCMCYLGSNNRLTLTKEFKRDMDNKELTVYPSRLLKGQIIRSFDYHLPKLMKKYPTYKPMVQYDE